MKIVLGSDERGAALKDVLRSRLAENGIEIEDYGSEAHGVEDDALSRRVAQARSNFTSGGNSANTQSSCWAVVVEEKMRITSCGWVFCTCRQAARKARVSSRNWPTGVQRSHSH